MGKRRGGITLLHIQYKPVEKMAERIVGAVKENSKIDFTGFKKTTIAKSLATLEDLGFIIRKTNSIKVLSKLIEFKLYPEKRSSIFAEGALKMKSFATFIDILKTHEKDMQPTLQKLAMELKEKLGVDWEYNTAETNTKIMLNWARHTNLAPKIFAEAQKGRWKGSKKNTCTQMALFPDDKDQ
jgi:hypothetical protein